MTAITTAPVTRSLVPTAVAVVTPAGVEFRIQHELKSPNLFLGRRWYAKARERARWQAAFVLALEAAVGVRDAQILLAPTNGTLYGCLGGCRVRRRVEVVRLAPSRRRWIRDDDNLRFAVKPLLDALKRCGLIRDDHRKWIDLPVPTQDLSPDGTFWTRIVLTDVR